jgi:hypothetical protein
MQGPHFFPPHPALSGYISHVMVMEAEHSSSKAQQIAFYPPMPQNVLNFYPADAITLIYYKELTKYTRPSNETSG